MGATGTLHNAKMALVGGTYFGSMQGDDAVRINCVIEFLQRMRSINTHPSISGFAHTAYPVIIADASPSDMHNLLRELFESYGAIVLDARSRPGIGTQNQAAIGYALEQGAVFITRTELEKYGLADTQVLEAIYARMCRGDVDILCIGRMVGEAYESLPSCQQATERVMSRAIASLGLPEDTACGLRTMTRDGAELVCRFDTDRQGNQWQFLWYCLLEAISSNLEVDGLFVSLIHPPEMTKLETGSPAYDEKRFQQAALLIPAIVTFAATFGISPSWDPSRKWVI